MTKNGQKMSHLFAGWRAIILLAGVIAVVPATCFTAKTGYGLAAGSIETSSGTGLVPAWNRTWGFGDTPADQVAVDGSGNIYVVGSTNGFGAGGFDALLTKYSPTGTVLLNITWGSTNDDWGTDVAIGPNGSVFLVGETYTPSIIGWQAFIVKYNSAGMKLWNSTWGGTGTEDAYGVAVDKAGNAYMVGSTNTPGPTQSFIVKYNSTGNETWEKLWDGNNNAAAQEVTVDGSGNAYVVGSTDSFSVGLEDVLILKYNSAGTLQWNASWGGTGHDVGNGVAVDASGNIFITGSTGSFGAGDWDAFLLKYNSTGSQQWNRTWGGTKADYGEADVVDDAGNAYITGGTNSFGAGHSDAFLVNYTSAGAQGWNCTWGTSGVETAYGVANSSGGVYYISGGMIKNGTTNRNSFLLKYNLLAPVATILNALTSPSSTGNITLSWSVVSAATTYSVYRATSTITSVASLMPIATGLTTTTYSDNGLENGVYYFVVVAINAIGASPISNCVNVTVSLSQNQGPVPAPPGIPGYVISLVIAGLAIAIVTLVGKYRKEALIHPVS
ncbi:MAG TPA: SBBP repeat-containing protein [Candidatus Lokiarchaeia archaeon]|nr:SBBP repeat-containing protein [Candidatus Lokiarchaeia archaeon]